MYEWCCHVFNNKGASKVRAEREVHDVAVGNFPGMPLVLRFTMRLQGSVIKVDD